MLKSTTIKNRVLCLILVCAVELCVVPCISQASQGNSPCGADKLKIVERCLQFPPVIEPLKLGEENEIPLLLNGFKVISAEARWMYYTKTGSLPFSMHKKKVKVLYHADGSAYVKISPKKFGRIQLSIGACFEDGSFAEAIIDAEVIFPDRKPEKFLIARGAWSGCTITSGTIYLDLSKSFKGEIICPIILYKGEVHRVRIPAKDVSFKLITASENDPPIILDESTGSIEALHIGHALIQATFQGLSNLTCVAVVKDARFTGNGTACSELVPAGMTAPLTGYEGLREKVKAWNEARQHKQPQQ